MATTIQEYVAERKITALVHFTREENLASILTRGLVCRDVLAREGTTTFNDAYRLDHTSAICLSIGFPNYQDVLWLADEQPDPEMGCHWYPSIRALDKPLRVLHCQRSFSCRERHTTV